jgi:hypothetical protein
MMAYMAALQYDVLERNPRPVRAPARRASPASERGAQVAGPVHRSGPGLVQAHSPQRARQSPERARNDAEVRKRRACPRDHGDMADGAIYPKCENAARARAIMATWPMARFISCGRGPPGRFIGARHVRTGRSVSDTTAIRIAKTRFHRPSPPAHVTCTGRAFISSGGGQ